jgi:outer membrane protein assembly factor BamB
MKWKILTAFTAATLAVPAVAENWSQWRGVNRVGHSPDKGLLKSWPEGGPKQTWVFKEAGVGYSGPAIVDGKLYTLGAREDEEQLIVLDAKTGKEVWHVAISSIYDNKWGNGPRSTPTIENGVAYVMTAKGDCAAIDLASKKILWKVSMTDDLGGKLPGWGYTESVLLDGDKIICTPGGKKGAVAALESKTGKVIWQSAEMAEEAWYSSPVKATIQGKEQYVQLAHGNLFGVDAKSGAVLWKTDWRGGVAVIPTPIIDGDSVYITSGYNAGCKRVTISASGEAVVDFDNEGSSMVNHHGGVIARDGHVFGHSEKGGWTCQNLKTGEVVWKDKSLGKGAIGYADGMFYCQSEDKGEIVLIEASTSAWSEKGRFVLEPQSSIRKKDGRIWTHPVILDGNLYLRDQDHIYCYDVKGE